MTDEKKDIITIKYTYKEYENVTILSLYYWKIKDELCTFPKISWRSLKRSKSCKSSADIYVGGNGNFRAEWRCKFIK